MFRTIKSRFFFINIVILISIFLMLLVLSVIFYNYRMNSILKDNTSYIYEFENLTSVEELVLYNRYSEENFHLESEIIYSYIHDFFYMMIFFITFLFLGILLILPLIYSKLYDKAITPHFNIKDSKVQEFKEINRNIQRKDQEIYNQKEDLYKINKYITHEFKNSLMALKGKVYTDKEEGIKYIDEINKQIDDLNALTTNKVDIVDLDFLVICAEVIDTFNQNINFSFSEDDFDVKGNTTLIYRVLYNIIENAFKYGAHEVNVNVKKQGENVICTIQNDGPKLDEEKMDDIFKLNYRINTLNKKGSGIGLSLVKNVMEILNGSIYVKSTDESTTFYLSFVSSN